MRSVLVRILTMDEVIFLLFLAVAETMDIDFPFFKNEFSSLKSEWFFCELLKLIRVQRYS